MTRRVALVTGGARGIGRAIAEDLARDHDLAVTWLSTDPQDALPQALWLRADLAKPGAAADIIRQVLDRYGRLDVIVNNAGQVSASPLDVVDMDALQTLLAVNLLAPHALLAAALPHLEPGASVVSVSSVNAVLPPMGAALYGASKAGLNLWTRGMAKELGPRGIRVNAVAPGAVEAADRPRDPDLVAAFEGMTAMGRLATEAEIAATVRFLSGSTASGITGEVLAVSAGYRL